MYYLLVSFPADDSSRVVLSVPNTSGTDYINASFVNVSHADTVYLHLCVLHAEESQLCKLIMCYLLSLMFTSVCVP